MTLVITQGRNDCFADRWFDVKKGTCSRQQVRETDAAKFDARGTSVEASAIPSLHFILALAT